MAIALYTLPVKDRTGHSGRGGSPNLYLLDEGVDEGPGLGQLAGLAGPDYDSYHLYLGLA